MEVKRYEEIHELSEDDDFEVVSKVWKIVEQILMAAMLVLLVACVVTERKKGKIDKREREILMIMATFVLQSIIAHLICFLASVLLLTVLWCIGKKEKAYRLQKYYPWLKKAIEAKFTIVCFILGLRILWRGELDDRELHLVFFITMVIFCSLILIVRIAWFCTHAGHHKRLEKRGDKMYLISGDEANKEEVKRLLHEADDAYSVKKGTLIGRMEGLDYK